MLAFKEPCDEMDGSTSRQRSDRICTRTNSVLSKHSSSGETQGGSSGGGTPTHLSKQDSVGGGRSTGAYEVRSNLTVIAIHDHCAKINVSYCNTQLDIDLQETLITCYLLKSLRTILGMFNII